MLTKINSKSIAILGISSILLAGCGATTHVHTNGKVSHKKNTPAKTKPFKLHGKPIIAPKKQNTSNGSTSNNTSGGGNVSSSSPPVVSPTPTTTSPVPTTPVSTTPRCSAGSVHIAVINGATVPGKAQIIYSITNTSGVTCTLKGYPGVTLSSSGNTYNVEVDDGNGPTFTSPPPTTVTLAPGNVASYKLGFSTVESGNNVCHAANTENFNMPGGTHTDSVNNLIAPCGPLYVSSISSGTAG